MNSTKKMIKLLETAEEFLQYNLDNVDYNSITENTLFLTNAKYGILNLYKEESKNYEKVGEAGEKESLTKLSSEKTKNIIVKDKIVGSFSLFTSLEEELLGEDYLETYIRHTGLLLDKLYSEKSLKEIEKKFISYRDTAPFAMMVFDSSSKKIIDSNKEATVLSGYTYDELIGMATENLFPEEVKKTVCNCMGKSNLSGKGIKELRIIRKNGETIDVEFTCIKLSETIFRCFLKDITEEKLGHEELKHMNLMKNTLLDNTVQMFLLLDKNYRIIDYNRMSEYVARNLFQVELYIGTSINIFVPAENKGFFISKFQEAFQGKNDKSEILIKDSKGNDLFFELSLNPVKDEKTGEIWAVSLTGYNITDLKEIEKALRKSEERFRMAAMSTSDLIYELDLSDNKITWFGDYEKFGILGLAFYPKTFEEWLSCVHPEDQTRLYQYTENNLHERKPYSGEYRLIDKNGRVIFVEDYSLGLYDEQNVMNKIVGAITNISDRKYYEEQLKFLSYFDQLTEVNNRGYFEEQLKTLQGTIYPVSIIVIDLDGLKLVNDTMGHYSGDLQLKDTANVIKKSVSEKNIIARIGGDEFAVILPGVSEKEAEGIMEIIYENIEKHNKNDQIIPISISCGIATSMDGTSLEEVFKRADDYMYRNKLIKGNSGKSQIIKSLMATLAERDYITEGHASRLSDICIKIGMKMNLSYQKINNLDLLAKVHDLGKVGIPDTILLKPSLLNAEEWEIMKLHPEKGFRIAISAPDLAGIADLILKHHERWDGKGYPIALKGQDIPLECRILSVADTFDAITNDRPYSKARSKEEAIAEIVRCSGTQFDPEVVKVFLEII